MSFCQFISHLSIKSEFSFPSQQYATTVPYNESFDYSSLSDILFTNNPFNIILPYFFGAPISYFNLIYSVLFAISFD